MVLKLEEVDEEDEGIFNEGVEIILTSVDFFVPVASVVIEDITCVIEVFIIF